MTSVKILKKPFLMLPNTLEFFHKFIHLNVDSFVLKYLYNFRFPPY